MGFEKYVAFFYRQPCNPKLIILLLFLPQIPIYVQILQGIFFTSIGLLFAKGFCRNQNQVSSCIKIEKQMARFIVILLFYILPSLIVALSYARKEEILPTHKLRNILITFGVDLFLLPLLNIPFQHLISSKIKDKPLDGFILLFANRKYQQVATLKRRFIESGVTLDMLRARNVHRRANLFADNPNYPDDPELSDNSSNNDSNEGNEADPNEGNNNNVPNSGRVNVRNEDLQGVNQGDEEEPVLEEERRTTRQLISRQSSIQNALENVGSEEQTQSFGMDMGTQFNSVHQSNPSFVMRTNNSLSNLQQFRVGGGANQHQQQQFTLNDSDILGLYNQSNTQIGARKYSQSSGSGGGKGGGGGGGTFSDLNENSNGSRDLSGEGYNSQQQQQQQQQQFSFYQQQQIEWEREDDQEFQDKGLNPPLRNQARISLDDDMIDKSFSNYEEIEQRTARRKIRRPNQLQNQ